MYDDAWYNFVPDTGHKRNPSASQESGHKRRESLLDPKPNGTNQQNAAEALQDVFEEEEIDTGPPEATLSRRAKSYTDFYYVVKAQLAKDNAKKTRRKKKDRTLEALSVSDSGNEVENSLQLPFENLDDRLLEASQQEHLLYRDQLAMTERHLDLLIEDTNSALEILASLADSFQAVDAQTSSFQAQCDDLISEEKRLQKLADEVSTDFRYYEYLDGATRRLNAPGASRLVDHENFGDILRSLNACIGFMEKHPDYRDADSYLARYQALLVKALHLIEVGFNNHLQRISSEVAPQIAGTQSGAARHAIAYGRFEGSVLEADGLILNVQRAVASAYDQLGNPVSEQSFDTYANTASNLFSTYFDVRDRDLKPITQQDLEAFRKDTKDGNIESASRNFVKQCYERSFNESALFTKIFSIEPQFSMDPRSAYAAMKSHQKTLVNIANVAPIAAHLQSILQMADLQTICNVIGWITNEYLMIEYDEEETPYTLHCQGLTARLLFDHLWTFIDSSFESEITKSISRAVINPDTLRILPITSGMASSNAHTITKHALELLVKYDQAMPRERSQKSSPIIFKIVHETILALQRAETKLRTTIRGATIPETDPDLFMIKNLLILKNELLALEIGDVRNHAASMQHFGQIWDTLSPQNWMGLFRGVLGGSLNLRSWFIGTPADRKPAPLSGSRNPAQQQVEQDASERLDELLRQSIYGFTQRWGALINDATIGKKGAKSIQVIEKQLEDKLAVAFGGQPEVVGKLKEAIANAAQALRESGGKNGR